ncbi:uncharacterized protein NPIL_303021 [Nephila pilipes]|uniref:DUF7041 domain-containing protein n=1 Tax=Nephila pilipes TaxID=299642 RepID=A0A8X6T2N0_NEPPI|nr:uncharacterized protein NPIL_303021 [Nephila pilipes]
MEEVSAVQIPAFIPSTPSLWYTMLESIFELVVPKPITTSSTKYNHCVASLLSEIAMSVRNIIISPDKSDTYAQLKKEIISRCGESKTQEIRRLLVGEQFHDRKPSKLLIAMQRCAENQNVINSLLLELFLQQLPSNVQFVLSSISPLTAQKAAEIADKILGISPIQKLRCYVFPEVILEIVSLVFGRKAQMLKMNCVGTIVNICASSNSSNCTFDCDRETNFLVDTGSDCCLIPATSSDKLSVPTKTSLQLVVLQ